MATRTIEDLRIKQALPLNLKVKMTEARIKEWVDFYGEDGVYVSFSGGKDSTVLLHIVRGLYPNIPAVFVNTGLEYPEIQSFVRTFDNVTILKPKMPFTEVLSKFGYPFISKRTAHTVDVVRRNGEKSRYWQFFQAESKSLFNVSKYKPLLKVDFNLTSYCCDIMKKRPIHELNKRKLAALTAAMAAESQERQKTWLQNGCNAFGLKYPISNPMAFWTEQDVLKFIKTEGIAIASVYGDVVAVDEDGYEYDQSLIECKYKTTGCNRTGCIFCGFGAHLEKGEGRFQRLKRTHPKQYDYCMGGGAYDSDGLWKPTKEGLGMAHCIDELCKIYGKDFIKY